VSGGAGGVLTLFLRRELRDIRGNARVWPLYFVFPFIGIGVPVLLAALAPVWVEGGRPVDRDAQVLINLVQRLTEFRGLPPAEAIARYLLRTAAGLFLLMPVAMASTSAAFSIVGEKQQRTLEPILATPISDRQFLLAKLLASTAPTVIATIVVAVVATVAVDLMTVARYGKLLLPDRYWAVSALVLGPLLAVAVALVTMRLSAKATDPQATVQTTAFLILPAFLIGLALFGKILTTYFPALLISCGLVALIDVVLFRGNVRRFQREEILTRWA
jgi:ABC-2 type transport system permease protein